MTGKRQFDPRFDQTYRMKKIFEWNFGHWPDENELREFREERDEKDQRSKAYWSQYRLNTVSK